MLPPCTALAWRVQHATRNVGIGQVALTALLDPFRVRRGGRVVEGARLESVYTGNGIAGSNPAPSASCRYQYIDSNAFLASLGDDAPQNTPHLQLACTGSAWTLLDSCAREG